MNSFLAMLYVKRPIVVWKETCIRDKHISEELLWRSAVFFKDMIWYFIRTCNKDVMQKEIYNDTETGLQYCGKRTMYKTCGKSISIYTHAWILKYIHWYMYTRNSQIKCCYKSSCRFRHTRDRRTMPSHCPEVHTWIYMYIHICMYVYIYAYVYVCICTCIFDHVAQRCIDSKFSCMCTCT